MDSSTFSFISWGSERATIENTMKKMEYWVNNNISISLLKIFMPYFLCIALGFCKQQYKIYSDIRKSVSEVDLILNKFYFQQHFA